MSGTAKSTNLDNKTPHPEAPAYNASLTDYIWSDDWNDLAATANDVYIHSQVTTGNPHDVSASDVGLGNVNNIADASQIALGTVTSGDIDAIANYIPNTDAIADLSGKVSGDIFYWTTALQRLAKGTDGHVLVLASGVPAWALAGGGDAYLAATQTFTGVNTFSNVIYGLNGGDTRRTSLVAWDTTKQFINNDVRSVADGAYTKDIIYKYNRNSNNAYTEYEENWYNGASYNNIKSTSGGIEFDNQIITGKGTRQCVLVNDGRYSSISSTDHWKNGILFDAVGEYASWNVIVPDEVPAGATVTVKVMYHTYQVAFTWSILHYISSHSQSEDCVTVGNNCRNGTAINYYANATAYRNITITAYSGTTPVAGDLLTVGLYDNTGQSWMVIKAVWIEWS